MIHLAQRVFLFPQHDVSSVKSQANPDIPVCLLISQPAYSTAASACCFATHLHPRPFCFLFHFMLACACRIEGCDNTHLWTNVVLIELNMVNIRPAMLF